MPGRLFADPVLHKPYLSESISDTSLILNSAWIFVWGNEEAAGSAVILILFNVVFYPTIALVAFFLYRAYEAKVYDLWLTRFLALNGLLFYATWTTLGSLLNLTIAVQYDADYDGSNAAYIALSLLTATVITYFILENTLFDRFLRYAFTVYPGHYLDSVCSDGKEME